MEEAMLVMTILIWIVIFIGLIPSAGIIGALAWIGAGLGSAVIVGCVVGALAFFLVNGF